MMTSQEIDTNNDVILWCILQNVETGRVNGPRLVNPWAPPCWNYVTPCVAPIGRPHSDGSALGARTSQTVFNRSRVAEIIKHARYCPLDSKWWLLHAHSVTIWLRKWPRVDECTATSTPCAAGLMRLCWPSRYTPCCRTWMQFTPKSCISFKNVLRK